MRKFNKDEPYLTMSGVAKNFDPKSTATNIQCSLTVNGNDFFIDVTGRTQKEAEQKYNDAWERITNSNKQPSEDEDYKRELEKLCKEYKPPLINRMGGKRRTKKEWE
ncbi:MAG: hypothetical protein DRH97_00055 [Chloroflexi bacterium]|nr:MAG: hypothetical protein DRH97_00055 [Chloroflexota bacterium]